MSERTGAIVEVDASGVVAESNGVLESLLSRPVVGRPFGELLDATSQGKWRRLREGGIDEEATGRPWELVLEGQSGLELLTFVTARGDGRDGVSLRLVEVPSDLPKDRLTEQLVAVATELADTQRALSRERTRLSRALERAEEARQRAEQATRSRDEVLSVVAHDLRNPVNSIVLAVDALLTMELPVARRMALLRAIEQAAHGMDRLIRDLLDVARIESQRLRLELRSEPVAPILGEIEALFGLKAAEKSIALTTAVEAGLAPVRADRGRVVQVLSNLVGNALKFTQPAGRVEVRVAPSNGDALFSVSDNGPGIPPEELPHIFERFWQPREQRKGGTGLGLAIARGIVEAHGGRIHAESTPGAGSTFRFTIPLATQAPF